jgi:hypothetical protein
VNKGVFELAGMVFPYLVVGFCLGLVVRGPKEIAEPVELPKTDIEKVKQEEFQTGASLGYEMAMRGGTRDELISILFYSKRENDLEFLHKWFRERLPVIKLVDPELEKIESVTIND